MRLDECKAADTEICSKGNDRRTRPDMEEGEIRCRSITGGKRMEHPQLGPEKGSQAAAEVCERTPAESFGEPVTEPKE